MKIWTIRSRGKMSGNTESFVLRASIAVIIPVTLRANHFQVYRSLVIKI